MNKKKPKTTTIQFRCTEIQKKKILEGIGAAQARINNSLPADEYKVTGGEILLHLVNTYSPKLRKIKRS